MTRAEFQSWASWATSTFAREGRISALNRKFAEEIRPHDAKLADLYIELAEANEAIRAHLTEPR